ncbi:MAG: hypothetical protein WA997_18275 [Anaerolineales bacterium]|jgi:hypothetical protein|nr:hypothetical protein [Anaerolineales bacterium]
MKVEIDHLANQILDNEPHAVVRWQLIHKNTKSGVLFKKFSV